MKTCWQIRQECYPDKNPSTSSGWLLECAECTAFHTGISCWELDHGSPCCCAPVHITCDFCPLYIQHRRELTALINKGTECNTSDKQGGTPVIMDNLRLFIPDMYADHHVLRVRAVLSALGGVQQVLASSGFHSVALTFDSSVVSGEAIRAALAEAGYPPADMPVEDVPIVPQANGSADPAWARLGVRISRTDARDAKAAR